MSARARAAAASKQCAASQRAVIASPNPAFVHTRAASPATSPRLLKPMTWMSAPRGPRGVGHKLPRRRTGVPHRRAAASASVARVPLARGIDRLAEQARDIRKGRRAGFSRDAAGASARRANGERWPGSGPGRSDRWGSFEHRLRASRPARVVHDDQEIQTRIDWALPHFTVNGGNTRQGPRVSTRAPTIRSKGTACPS